MKEPNLERMSKEDIDEIKIDAYMSKEQTPIAAEGLYDDKMGSDSVWKEDCVELMEQYAEIVSQAKVLEALERDLKDLSDCYKAHAEDNPRKEVCLVLHTLIMEKQEQIAQTKQK